jgi:RNA polymerase sigma factor (sigma-70 family)
MEPWRDRRPFSSSEPETRNVSVSSSSEREDAFAAFVAAVRDSLLRAAFVLLGTREEAEDAVQLTLLRTLRHWARVQQAPEAYSRVVLLSICRERWRHRTRHPEAAGPVPEECSPAVVTSFTDAVERRLVLVRALRRLSVVQREVLVCRYLLDATVAQTATALGIAEGTVKSAANRGLEQLRGLLSGDDGEDGETKEVCHVHRRG